MASSENAVKCNIDAKGKAVRLVWGLLMLFTAAALAVALLLGILSSNWWWVAAGGFTAFGAVGLFEARAGWCMVRAMGFRTPV